MIWHVPNDVSILEASEQSSLRYYTQNHFLTKYGGNLRLLYDKYYPMKVVDNPGNQTFHIIPLALG